MKLLLAFDTATRNGSVALARDGGMLEERVIGSSVRHAETLLPTIAAVLDEHRFSASELTGIVVGAGPGSFTGVRVAAATARGLVRALGIPLYAYSSLLAAAMATGRFDRAVCALFDARRGEVYAGCWRFHADTAGPGWETLLAPVAAPVREIMAAVTPHEPILVGDGAHLAGADAEDAPRAGALLHFAELDPDAGRVAAPARWEPLYLRESGAVRP